LVGLDEARTEILRKLYVEELMDMTLSMEVQILKVYRKEMLGNRDVLKG
jgi:hypothetical protein